MPAKAKHRRPRSSPFARGFAAVGTGGAVLALPFVAATAAQAAPAHSAAEAPRPLTGTLSGTSEKGSPETYSVVAGDSLSGIAAGYSVSGGWKKLYEDNRDVIGGNPALIRPGMKLTLGARTASQEPAGSTTAGEAVSTTAENATAENAPAESATAENAPADAAGTVTEATPAAEKTYTNDLDGWIKESLDVMAANGIPGSYDGIYRNIMRESSGNPQAINNWDSNAAAGTPSKGLLQVIDPTFQAYHVPGTSMDSFDPVANITAACNYAADRYGSIDNVNGPY
ncbi:LysM peptidoglycan-binding domain-containing protein [Streptomyces sp. GMY02]|uniref:transglycosylase SLT domain-containing protein n=1 Tax=Streptomyces sp. GMY02 TaxID=1333528 RepID=UPI001C2C5F2D|nr:LysM peptidoglycan-binding domain-containing protein [Streptomyces sp. GMY02]QXE34223.1 LysM peptidoglycan-binding domain-containing protein [Streptomyces sp. GMY02]